ncbi:hypothetical protein [Shimia sp. R10_1]|uniref:hypothetical protein n=1 Tax=Shimia sp. R10_1 TaxID=2821095 RepID=UPI001ADAA2C8|nr:hypothetical protein [Shimia sp. R10_1]
MNFDPFTTDSWRGQEPEFGNTIRERDDRFRMLGRAVEVGDISEKAAPKDYVLWLDKCGYIISEAWRRAVGFERKVFGGMEQDQLSSLQEENARLRRDLEERATQATAQGDVQRRLAALGDENENLQRQVEALSVVSTDDKNEEANQIKKLQRRIRQLTEGPANPSEKSALTRKVICLEKILIGAVCDAYNFDLRATRSDTAKQIAAKTVELNCDVAESTILNYIRESANTHVDPDVWGQMYPRKYGPVTFLCRPKSSFRPLFSRKRRGFSNPMLSAVGADCRNR